MKVSIYGTQRCGYCVKAKALCEEKGIEYTWIDIHKDPDAKVYVVETLGAKTVPQIFVDKVHIGGYNEFAAHLK